MCRSAELISTERDCRRTEFISIERESAAERSSLAQREIAAERSSLAERERECRSVELIGILRVPRRRAGRPTLGAVTEWREGQRLIERVRE